MEAQTILTSQSNPVKRCWKWDNSQLHVLPSSITLAPKQVHTPQLDVDAKLSPCSCLIINECQKIGWQKDTSSIKGWWENSTIPWRKMKQILTCYKNHFKMYQRAQSTTWNLEPTWSKHGATLREIGISSHFLHSSELNNKNWEMSSSNLISFGPAEEVITIVKRNRLQNEINVSQLVMSK